MPTTISAALEGKERLLASWPHRIAGDAFEIVWREKFAVDGFEAGRRTMAEDPRWSPLAMKENTATAAAEGLRELGGAHSDLRKLRADADGHRRQALATRPTADASQALIDLEIARTFRSLPEREAGRARAALRQGSDRAMIKVLIRASSFVSGADPDVVASAQVALLHREQPDLAEALQPRQAELAGAAVRFRLHPEPAAAAARGGAAAGGQIAAALTAVP